METNLDRLLDLARRGPRWRAIVLRSILTITLTVVARAAPSSLVANEGQWNSNVAFAGSLAGLDVRVERDGLLLIACDRMHQRGAAVHVAFEGASANPPVGCDLLPGRSSYFLGRDPARWRAGLPRFGSVRFPSVWNGVDLIVGEENGQLSLRIEVAPGVDPSIIRLRIDSGSELRLEHPADVIVPTGLGDLGVHLRAEQSASGGSNSVLHGAYLFADDRLSIQVPARDPSLPVVINLGLDWSTFVGGSGSDYIRKIAVAPSGGIVVGGETGSSDYPLTPGAFDMTSEVSWEVFVSRFDASGTQLQMSTYLGGSDQDFPMGIGVAQDGSVVVGGITHSSDFPTTPGAYDQVLGGFVDYFAARISEDGQVLVWSTLIGSTGVIGEVGIRYDMALAPDDSVYLFGESRDSSTYPVTHGAYDTTPDPQYVGELVISHISSDGSQLLHSTFFGGTSEDLPRAICVMSDGVVVTGIADSLDFPISPGAYDPSPPGQFVSKLDLTLSHLMFSTILKDANGVGADLHDVAADPSGNVTVVGDTDSDSWPVTPGAFDTNYGGGLGGDGFVTKLNSTGTALVYSTYLGGGGRDGVWAIDVDSAGVATVAGYTDAFNQFGFPVTPGAWDVTGNGEFDAFVVRLSPSGNSVWYGTFLGGALSDTDDGEGSKLDVLDQVDGSALIAGETNSRDFPVTAGAFDSTMSGSVDSYLTELSMLPTGVARYGSSTEGCAGYLAMGVTAIPKIGKPFSMTCRNAPPSSGGLLALGLTDLPQPLLAKGAALWVDPNPLLVLLLLHSNSVGFASLGGVLPNDPSLAGASFTVQCFWPDACAADGPYAASNALAITIQP